MPRTFILLATAKGRTKAKAATALGIFMVPREKKNSWDEICDYEG
jgi:hypothetical protein